MKKTLLLSGLLAGATLFAQTAKKPFPQQQSWTGCIKPAVTQTQLNSDVTSVYDYWKTTFLKTANTTGYFVNGPSTDGSGKGTSESHGYGMLITVLMAGYDANAKTYFDGLYNFFNTHRSSINNELMGWFIDNAETSGSYDSATDGDMDIAYALILAHYQWGSNGTINYLQEAIDMITKGIKAADTDASTYRIKLGDWQTNKYNTRPSDWMADHMRAYKSVTNDAHWDNVANKIYELTNTMQTSYSSSTGLMPDFVVNATPKPAAPNFLEAATDGDFSWNACRFPWRLTMDYGHYGTPEAKTYISKIMTWAKTKTSNNPSKFMAGYKLDGTALETYSDLAFTAPIVTASIVDASYQTFLNSGWNILKAGKDDYYGTSINLLCMLFISGNWWVPQDTPTNLVQQNFSSTNVYPNPSNHNFTLNLAGLGVREISIYNLSGELVSTVEVPAQDQITFGEDLAAGMYLLRIKSEIGIDQYKIVKQ